MVGEGVCMVILSILLVVLVFRVVLLTYPELRFWGRRIDQRISKEKHDSTV